MLNVYSPGSYNDLEMGRPGPFRLGSLVDQNSLALVTLRPDLLPPRHVNSWVLHSMIQFCKIYMAMHEILPKVLSE